MKTRLKQEPWVEEQIKDLRTLHNEIRRFLKKNGQPYPKILPSVLQNEEINNKQI